MSFILEAELVPLAEDADGTIRVASTRVTLDTIVASFKDGAVEKKLPCAIQHLSWLMFMRLLPTICATRQRWNAI
jgi:hypothetical protein